MTEKKRKYQVRGECPQCACGDVSFLGPETLKDKYIGPESEMEVLCPACGTKHKATVVQEEQAKK
jgi:Zn finger protein HypA/HybF involved in hydrogenase expression